MSPLLLLILQLVIVLATARVVGYFFRLIGQPQVVGEMVAGIVLGPSVLGWVAPHAEAILFPSESLVALNSLSQVGLLVFMFLVGLEFDPARLKGRGDAAVLTSHASIIIPFLLGSLVALVLYPRLSDASVPFTAFALFAGASMSVTAFPVLARILTERNLTRTRVGAVAIACAAVDDVTAWSILALVVVIVRASAAEVPFWVTIGGALLYVAVMLTVGRRALRVLQRYFLSRGRVTQDLLAAVVLLLLASAWMTERLGIHALFGAFALGAVMPKHARFTHEITDRLEDVTVVLLLPLFFAFTGLRTSVGLVQGAQGWTMFGLVLLAATVGKFGGSALAARLTELSWRESGAIGVLMNTRGLMELIIISIGLELGVISPELFAMMVLMALVTTFLTTPALAWIYPERLSRAELLQEPITTRTHRSPDEPAVVVPVSLPSAGPALLRAACACAWPAKPGRVYAVHLSRVADDITTDPPSGIATWTDQVLAPLLAAASADGVRVTPIQFVSRDVGQDLADIAEAKCADLLLMGWHKPVLSRSVLGGAVYDVISRATCDVGVLVDRGHAEWRRILVPYVGSEHDERAMDLARRIAAASTAELTVLAVEPANSMTSPSWTAAWRERVTDAGTQPYGERPTQSPKLLRVRSASPRDALVEEARHGYDLVVLGVSRVWGTEPTLFSMRHEAIAAASSASLLVVRAGTRRREVANYERAELEPAKRESAEHSTVAAMAAHTA